ncbi:hypothetical protein F1737_08380 [Methanoplanus sp. FWC-SCC4]|uniref:Uncharacterized protein n=1 Tax=Methanochimaera problematica TaxID=2609417 RepID=A0AA97FER9_9EURY|nr:hypothetical protein [Methanoplanus sp. FWC-SCC4]WOF16703.1 hypothetical protein F1737_08380 [Methanoplanus sp. FWC-SCC4]
MVKLPDKKSLEGLSKKVGEAVKLPEKPEDKEIAETNDSQTASVPNGLSEEEINKIREEERKKIEQERIEKEKAEKAKKYEEIEAEKRKEEERILEERKKQEELEKLEKERQAEEAIKEKEREEWKKEEERKKTEDEKKRQEIEKEILRKQKEEAKAAKKGGHLVRNIGIVVLLIAVILVAGYISLITGNDNIEAYGYPLSYSAQYDVLMPDSKEVSFGGIPVSAVTSGDSTILKIGNDRQSINKGETKTFQPKHITIKMFGMSVYDSDYQVTATYRGIVTNRIDLLMTIKTSAPIQQWLAKIMTPGGVAITPV